MKEDPCADLIRLDAQGWAAQGWVEGSYRCVCPYCGGGGQGEASLGVRINSRSQVSWRCFRASCGKVGGNREVTASKPSQKRPYTGAARGITELERTQYGLSPRPFPVDIRTGRVLLAIRGPDTELRGHILRDFTGQLKPKVLTYKDTDSPFIHWSWPWPECSDIVVVEDWLSAEQVGAVNEIQGVALLGTHMTADAEGEILQQAGTHRTVHVALDRDAFAKGIRLAARLSIALGRPVFTWRLDKDLKHVRLERIERAIHEREFDFISNP